MDNKQWNETGLLEEALQSKVENYRTSPLVQGESGTFVARITGHTRDGESFSVVIKTRNGESRHSSLWYIDDPKWIDREYHVYVLLKQLNLPHCRILASRYDSRNDWTLIFEDLSQNYRMLDRDYQFAHEDRIAIINAYACIHSRTMGLSGFIADQLQPEEGSQVDESTVDDMLDVLSDYSSNGIKFETTHFVKAATSLFSLREKWKNEPRCLVFNDFYQTNVALPKSGNETAILFDWELAGIGLPQFDAVNAGFAEEGLSNYYIHRMNELGVVIDKDKYLAGLQYAEISLDFYLLWLLYHRLKADPNGPIQPWMKSAADDLFCTKLKHYASLDV